MQTASHVISESPHARISEPTKQRIRDAAKELGYRPNRLAQAMKYGRTNVVALWVPSERLHTALGEFVAAFTKKAREASQDLVIIGLENDLAYGRTWRMPLNWPVDGIIALDCGRAVRQFAQQTGDASTPFCIIGSELVENSDNVTWDAQSTVRNLFVDRMTALQTKDAWHVSFDWILRDYPEEQRRSGFQEAANHTGTKGHEIAIAEQHRDDIEAKLSQALSISGTPRLIFAASESLASQVSIWAATRGFADQVEIWGYGSCKNAITAPGSIGLIEIPIEEIVEKAWEFVQSRIAAPDVDSRTAVFAMHTNAAC